MSSCADVLCELLEVAIHSILFVRGVYPASIAGYYSSCSCPIGLFERRKKYSVPVQVLVTEMPNGSSLNEDVPKCRSQSVHPQRADINSSLDCLGSHPCCAGHRLDIFIGKRRLCCCSYSLTGEGFVLVRFSCQSGHPVERFMFEMEYASALSLYVRLCCPRA